MYLFVRPGGQSIIDAIAVDPGNDVATLRVKVEEALGVYCRLLSPLGEPLGDLETLQGTGVEDGDVLQAVVVDFPQIVVTINGLGCGGDGALARIGSLGSVIT